MPKPNRSPLPVIAASAAVAAGLVIWFGFPRGAAPTSSTTTLVAPSSTAAPETTTTIGETTTTPAPETSTSAPQAPSTTTPRPSSTTTPRPSTTVDQTTPLSQIAGRMASDLTAAFWTLNSDDDPKIKAIWDRAEAAGAEVRMHPSGLTYTPPSYTKPWYSRAYTVSKGGEVYCVNQLEDSTYAPQPGDC